MAFYHPMQGYRSAEVTKNGKRKIVFSPQKGYIDLPVKVACGQCIGCRLERSRQWAIRCMHEAQMHEENSFVTLTYSDEHLPEGGKLVLDHFQRFFKRLRKRVGVPVRYYHCGEYGETFGRPHYHACIFGYGFPDRVLWSYSNGQPLYSSQELSDLWPYGHVLIGEVTFDSAAYVARYIMKKISEGHDIDSSMKWAQKYVDWSTGQILNPEYTTMSRRDGIGKNWLEKYLPDVYPHDYVVINGVKCKPPKYYDNVLQVSRPYEFDDIKENRLTRINEHADNNTPDRLAVRESITKARLKMLPRTVD